MVAKTVFMAPKVLQIKMGTSVLLARYHFIMYCMYCHPVPYLEPVPRSLVCWSILSCAPLSLVLV